MKLIRLIGFAGLMTLLAGCVYVERSTPTVTLNAPRGFLGSGESMVLSAAAYDPLQRQLFYEWREDGIMLDGEYPTLAYSRFVTTSTTVTLSVVARTPDGQTASESAKVTIQPPAQPGTLVLVNNSPYRVSSLYVSAAGAPQWGPDQMRVASGAQVPPGAAGLAQGATFRLPGIPSGTWEIEAIGPTGTPVWTYTMAFGVGESRTLTLY